MKAIRLKSWCFLLAVSAIGVTAPAVAQNTPADQSPVTAQSDEGFVSKSIRDSKMEVEMARLALEKSLNENIKDVAEILIKDHSEMVAELSRLNGGNAENAEESVNAHANARNDADATNNADADASDKTDADASDKTDADASTDNSNAANTPSGAAGDTGTASNQLDIAGTKTSKDLDSAAKNDAMAAQTGGAGNHHAMLENASGAEFDNMWVNQMLAQHKIKLGELHQARKTVSDPALKEIVQEAIPEIRTHRDMLEELKKNPDEPVTNKNVTGRKEKK